MQAEVITNNPDIEGLAPKEFSLVLMEGSTAKAVLTAARDRIHLGAKLLAHPMAGRLRPNETPYRTVVLDLGQENASASSAHRRPQDPHIDLTSLEIIEYCLAEEEKYAPMRIKYDAQLLPDLQFISCEIFRSILEELKVL